MNINTSATIGSLGIIAEEVSRYYLLKKDYKIIASNYKKPWGEIDMIAEKDEILVFLEVKAGRSGNSEFEPYRRVNQEKKKKIIKVAEFYLRENNLTYKKWQIDIPSVRIEDGGEKVRITHFKDI